MCAPIGQHQDRGLPPGRGRQVMTAWIMVMKYAKAVGAMIGETTVLSPEVLHIGVVLYHDLVPVHIDVYSSDSTSSFILHF